MLENIKDYILVKNCIPKEVCESMVRDIAANSPWEKHLWQNYGVVKERPTFPPTELDVAESTPEQNQQLYPYIGESLKQYEEHIKSNNSFDEFVSNCGLHIACPVRFNRYNTNTLMKSHHDHIHSLFDGERKGIPTLSIVGLLNDNYEGGNFRFFKDYEIELQQGDILIFPSIFIFPHRVDKVTKGTRYSFVSWAW
jgi:predicted 2-oxoglutarate/Fe(II)-dependent dioxygenase YbiX